MRYTILSLLTVSLLFSVLPSRSQSKIDTASWIKCNCTIYNYQLKYPSNYLIKDECGTPFKIINGINIFPFDMYLEKYFTKYRSTYTNKFNNFSEWINWRACVLFSADGPDESNYGDSIAAVSYFTNKYGIYVTELYVYVKCSMLENEVRRDYFSICGPVFAIKLNLPQTTDDYVLFLRPDEWDATNDERLILRLMVDNFDYLSNK